MRNVSRFGQLRVLALLAAAVLAGNPAAAQERLQGDVYTNSRHGVQIGKPPAWHFITAGTIVELAKKTAGASQLRGEDDPVKLTGFAVIVSKVASLGREIAPQVVLLVQELRERPTDLIKTCEGLRAGLNDPETVQPTREVKVDDRPAARLDFRGVVDGALVRATALCTVRDRQAYVVVAQALAADFETEARTFETILQSFRLK